MNSLAERAGYTTTAEWSRESGYAYPNLTNLRNGKGAIDGYNLLRLIRAAAARAQVTETELAEELAGGAESQRLLSDRLRDVEEGLTELASLIRQEIQDRGADGSSVTPHETSREGRAG